jgi:hypothetical protein
MIFSDIDRALAAADRCVVCNCPATHTGIYRPEGRTGVSVYGLCGRHIELALIIGDRIQPKINQEYSVTSWF